MSRSFTIDFVTTVPGLPEAAEARLGRPDFWRKRWPGCRQLEPLGDGQYLVVVDTVAPLPPGRLLGRISLHPPGEDGRRAMDLVLSGPAGDVRAQGQIRVSQGDDGLTLALDAHGEVNGRLAALSPRLLSSMGRSWLRQTLSPLAPENSAPLPPLTPAWPSPRAAARERAGLWLAGVLGLVLVAALWRRRP